MIAFIVIVWSIIGLVGGAVVATELGPLFGVRHMEGASAMFGVFTGAPMGLIAGGIFGYWKASGYGTDDAKRKRFLQFSLGGIAALVASGFIYETIRTSDYIDTKSQTAMWVNCRIRLPPGVAAPDKSQKVTLELRSDKETRKSSPYSVPKWETKDGRVETYSSVEAYRATDKRKIAVTIGDGPTYVYALRAPARPKVYTYEGEWQSAETVEGGEGRGVEVKCGM